MTAEGREEQTFVFADLAGYTALTEAHGDQTAADLAAGFSATVRAHLAEYGAHEVKSLGDGMLLRVPDAGDALRLAARLVNDIGARERSLGVRVGVHTGTAVRRDGDWFGEGVNIASRVADLARAGEVLLSAQTQAAVSDAIAPGQLETRGACELKNLGRPVEVLALVPEGRNHELRTDPVCRMAVGPGHEARRRAHRGVKYHFCSPACADAFDCDPDRYAHPARRVYHPFLEHEGPLAFAHRGGLEEGPENTMPAFESAVALGFRYLETDVHLTRDGVLVAFHDERLDRVTDAAGAIAELSIEAVEAADAGYRFAQGDRFPFRGRGVTVPRLEALLTRWPHVRINLDPKSDRCVAPLIALIDHLGAWDRVAFGSFSDVRLRRIRELSRGRACTSMGPRAVARATLSATTGRMRRQGADCVQVPVRQGPVPIVTRRFVRAAHEAGLPVHVWTVNDEHLMHGLLDLGVDGLMTDHPRLLRDVFVQRGLVL